MARVPDLIPFAPEHGLKIVTVADLIAYRRRNEKLVAPCRHRGHADRVRRLHGRRLPRRWSTASTTWRSSRATSPARKDVLVRVHSECLTGDVFGSLRCDCGEQLPRPLRRIEARGPRRAALHAPGGPRHRPAQQAPGLRAAGAGAATPSRPTSSWASPPTCATTASAPRSSSTSGSRTHPPPDQQPQEDRGAGGLRPARSPSACASRSRRRTTTGATCAPRRTRWGTCWSTRISSGRTKASRADALRRRPPQRRQRSRTMTTYEGMLNGKG